MSRARKVVRVTFCNEKNILTVYSGNVKGL